MLKLTQFLKLGRKFPRKLLIRQLPNIWKLTHIPRKFRIQFTAFIEFQATKIYIYISSNLLNVLLLCKKNSV